MPSVGAQRLATVTVDWQLPPDLIDTCWAGVHAGKTAGLWAIVPFQLIVMIGLGKPNLLLIVRSSSPQIFKSKSPREVFAI